MHEKSANNRRNGRCTHLAAPVGLTMSLMIGLASCAGDGPRSGAGNDPYPLECAAECAIELELLAVLGNGADTISPTLMSTVVQSGIGDFYVAPTDHPGVVAMYDPSGRLKNTFGRSGEGPGEYGDFLYLARDSDGLVNVIDANQARRTVVDSSGSIILSHPLPPNTHALLFLDSGVVAQADIRTSASHGLPLHALTATGEISRSFGDESGQYMTIFDGKRPLTQSSKGGYWLARSNRYEIESYDNQHRLRTVLRPEVEWFKPHDRLPAHDEPPEPQLMALHESEDGLLWVVIMVVDTEWRHRPVTGMPPPTLERLTTTVDWVIDVIDPNSKQSVARARSDTPLALSPYDGLLYSMVEAEDGRPIIRAYRPKLKGGVSQVPSSTPDPGVRPTN